jgi:acyl carrier protein phosphodiesterase
MPKILTDEEISKAFDASWATHGDRPSRFARIIEYTILEKMLLSYDDLLRLSQAFNREANLATDVDRRINEWLKAQIAALSK